ncbi:uncharacterized protein SAPINGB_P004637 [Magnusiomyces paraingens]|uniref:Tyrosine-protein phosphatase CDC14 n=1 Tax=Magnusiomyces paraingens TaxID=2606893 RepID=A0A5E8BVK2_9ASCO|nr:uncharacterized protein SAPINGB_P004637 [Saprochaete ingens]VVT55522.1 unnamed protein product [Saprochaete ingens]
MDTIQRTPPVIEFLRDRIYLGAFDVPPEDTNEMVHFTIDDSLPYNAFHHDFGPLHYGYLYRFAVILHGILNEESNEGKAVCLYSKPNPRDRANAACILCCYMVLIQSWPPHLVLAPIAQADPPFMPFRDAGYAPADFVLTIQDVVYGLWKAKEKRFLDIANFDLEEYELYERVDHGDFNEIPPHFVAFASPQQEVYETTLNYPFQQVLDYFTTHNVQLVVRLNSHLYDKMEFEQRGVKHIDLIFEDGTCPTMEYVQAFLGAAEGVIAQHGKIAVHCKAGLGRTGCLIGAYLIYAYGFTASEAIAYMRFIRPGMVVGPQQHWLYLHQNEFREWRRTMTVSPTASEKLAGFCPLVPRTVAALALHDSATSLTGVRGSAAHIRAVGGSLPTSASSTPRTPERSILGEVGETNTNSALPVPTPGQPRKGSPSPAHGQRGGSYYTNHHHNHHHNHNHSHHSHHNHTPAARARHESVEEVGDVGDRTLADAFDDNDNMEEDTRDGVQMRAALNTTSSSPTTTRARSNAVVGRVSGMSNTGSGVVGIGSPPATRRRASGRSVVSRFAGARVLSGDGHVRVRRPPVEGISYEKPSSDQENCGIIATGVSSMYTNSDEEKNVDEDEDEASGMSGGSSCSGPIADNEDDEATAAAVAAAAQRIAGSVLPGKRMVTESGLSTRQQLMMMRQVRSTSNPGNGNGLTPANSSTAGNISGAAVTTSATVVSVVTSGNGSGNGKYGDIGYGEGPARRVQRVTSGNGVRKTSGNSARHKR